MFKIKANFIASFKLGDNIHYNLEILSLLYNYFNNVTEDEKRLLCKPIIILLVSIIEAILHDFHLRIRVFTKEGVKTLATDIVNYVRSKNLDELEKYITSARKHNLFGENNQEICDYLDNLRRLRNRIHIQNKKGDYESNDKEAFTENRKNIAEKVLERILIIMSHEHPRNIDITGYVPDFKLPWKPYFGDENVLYDNDFDLLTLEEAIDLGLI